MAGLAFFLSLLLGWFLTALPIPFEYSHFWPLWVPSIMLAWVIVKPFEWTVVLAWFVGLSLDLIAGTPLVAQAFGLSVAAYAALLFRLRLKNLAPLMQGLLVGLLLVVYQGVQIWVRLLYDLQIDWTHVLAFLPGTWVVWPMLVWLVARLEQRLVN